MLRDVPLKSLTLDNDLSFQKHVELSELLKTIVFFCHPYQSSEKGTVENRNRAVRRYVPKRTNLSSVSVERFKEIEAILRTRYMKVLDFKTPEEAWEIEVEKEKYRGKRKWKRATVMPLLARTPKFIH
jgi:IS30 family transposase